MILRSEDGRAFLAIGDGSYVAGPGHESIGHDDDGRPSDCVMCGEQWPCPSDELVGVWFEGQQIPDDAQELYRLLRDVSVEYSALQKFLAWLRAVLSIGSAS